MKKDRWWDNNIWSCCRYNFGYSDRQRGWSMFHDCALDLEASQPGTLYALAGDEEVSFQLPRSPASAWEGVAQAAAAEPRLRKALLAGRLPQQIRRHLYQHRIVLEWDELPPGQCSCGGWPCAHACAIVYRLSSIAQAEPLSLLPLYGCDLEVFRRLLVESVPAESDWGDGFWRAAHAPAALPPLQLPAALERLGEIGVQVGGTDLVAYLSPLYARLRGEEEG